MNGGLGAGAKDVMGAGAVVRAWVMLSVLVTTQNTRSERVCGLPGFCVYGCGLPFSNQMSVGKPVTLNLAASARPPAVESASTFAITALLLYLSLRLAAAIRYSI